MLGIGLYMLPSYRKAWLESDPRFILQLREIEARAEADLAFRKREAELKAESEAAGQRLTKIEVPPSPLRDVVARTAPTVVNVSTSSNLPRRGAGGRWSPAVPAVPSAV